MAVRKRTWTTAKGEQREAWIVDYRDKQGDRHIETFTRKKDADAKHAEVSTAVRAGVHVAASKSKTVAEAGKIWVEAARLEGLERSTVEQYSAHLRLHIAPAIGSTKLCDLTRGDVQAFSDGLRKAGMSPAMVKKVLASLGSLIAEAMDRDLVARNVVRDITRSRKRRKAATTSLSLRSAWTFRRRMKSQPSWHTLRAVGVLCSWLPPSLACVLLSLGACAGLTWT